MKDVPITSNFLTLLFDGLQEKQGTTKISGTVSGFTGGNGMKHGFHIHENADKMNDCNANGGHFNPKGAEHGAPNATVR